MEITLEIIALFRTQVPAFADETKWPDNIVTIALCEGDAETGGSGWGGYDEDCHNFKQRGMFAYAAHWLTTYYPTGTAANDESQSGAANYPVASKSVGDESISFNNGNVSELSAGDAWFASTSWGQQFLRLRKRAGMGAKAVS